MKKIAVVVNKNWEVEPVIHALTSSELKPANLPFPEELNSPKPSNNQMDKPRAIIRFEQLTIVEIWCIQDLMYHYGIEDPSGLDKSKQSSSSSEEKDRVLKLLFKEKLNDAILVIAVGTAGYPLEGFAMAGSVVVGAEFFIKNGKVGNPKSKFEHELVGKLIGSNVNNDLFFKPPTGIFNNTFKNLTEPKFLPVPNHRAEKMVCIASPTNRAVSFVNVTDYSEYGWADHEAIEDYNEIVKRMPGTLEPHKSPVSSIETTHGIIKVNAGNIPTIYISAITDNLGYFNVEVTPSQNYTASYNAGIVIGELLCNLHEKVKVNSVFGNPSR